MRSEMMGLGESIQCVMRAEYLRGCADERAKCIAEIEALRDAPSYLDYRSSAFSDAIAALRALSVTNQPEEKDDQT